MERKGIIFDWIGTLAKSSNEGLFPYSEEVVRMLSGGYKLSLVSIAGFGIDKREEEIKESGLMKYFDHIIIDTVKTTRQYLECMEKMRTTPKTTLVIDDRTKRGIMIGNKLGCQTYWIKKGSYAHELPNEETGEPTKIIDSVKDLLDIL